MVQWKKLSEEEIKSRVFEAISKNVNYETQSVLGLPASYLDEKVFHRDASFLKDAPYLTTLLENPNHIGCHTLGTSEPFFRGTQELEKEVIEICGVDILGGDPGQQDGYVASGGTEANMQAIWIYRNYFLQKFDASLNEIGILCSRDNHYSMDKAANIFGLKTHKVAVQTNDRSMDPVHLQKVVADARKKGVKYFIVVANMMTTMFGSVDDIDPIIEVLDREDVEYKIHVDGAYGGFYYPFSQKENPLSFQHPKITSITLDAHKMAQAPYGTGIFIVRKGWMQYANTREASYIAGEDSTLIGSRSGANAVSIWMILMKYGPFGWREKIFILQKRTQWICEQLEEIGIDFYRHPHANIVTIPARFVPSTLAEKYGLIPDDHHQPNWYKIVVMEHVIIEKVLPLIKDLQSH